MSTTYRTTLDPVTWHEVVVEMKTARRGRQVLVVVEGSAAPTAERVLYNHLVYRPQLAATIGGGPLDHVVRTLAGAFLQQFGDIRKIGWHVSSRQIDQWIFERYQPLISEARKAKRPR